VIDVVDLDARRDLTAKLALNVGGFDLIWDGGPVMRFDKPTSLPSMLGTRRGFITGGCDHEERL
jgi:tubulin polyglutamylase TTLL9